MLKQIHKLLVLYSSFKTDEENKKIKSSSEWSICSGLLTRLIWFWSMVCQQFIPYNLVRGDGPRKTSFTLHFKRLCCGAHCHRCKGASICGLFIKHIYLNNKYPLGPKWSPLSNLCHIKKLEIVAILPPSSTLL